MRKRLPLAIALLASAAALAGCGSSRSGARAASSVPQDAMVMFARCMRANGVPNFPDSPGHGMQIQLTPNGTQVNGVAVNGPAFRSAMQRCHSKLPNGGQPPPLTASRRNAMLAFARCMREHGVPNFPDPVFSGNTARIRMTPASGINPSSPAFQQAQRACGRGIGDAP